ncbi:MAG: hypothetical protein KTR31_09760 [Myxococcales bacterium]|nr:hypothetical protein [Myxococcales bacterium]
MLVASTVMLWMGGCGSTVDDALPPATVLELTVRYAGDTDVLGFILRHGPTDCRAADRPSSVHEVALDLVNDLVIGAGLVSNEQLDPRTRTLISTFDLEVAPGCHWVQVVPLAAGGLSESCEGTEVVSPFAELHSRVEAEVTLACTAVVGSPGALVEIPPQIRNIDLPEAPVGQCEPVSVCVGAEDLDDDDLLSEWSWVDPEGTLELAESTMEVVGFSNGHREWLACSRVAGRIVGSHLARVVVWDLEGGDRGLSRDEAWVRLRVDWVAEPLCIDADGALVDDPSQARELSDGCAPTPAEDWWCSGAFDVDPKLAAALCDGTELVEAALYPACPAA